MSVKDGNPGRVQIIAICQNIQHLFPMLHGDLHDAVFPLFQLAAEVCLFDKSTRVGEIASSAAVMALSHNSSASIGVRA